MLRTMLTSPLDVLFQWAPTLGGECYYALEEVFEDHLARFQWAPTLGGECYCANWYGQPREVISFNGHPPLGVNATFLVGSDSRFS